MATTLYVLYIEKLLSKYLPHEMDCDMKLWIISKEKRYNFRQNCEDMATINKFSLSQTSKMAFEVLKIIFIILY